MSTSRLAAAVLVALALSSSGATAQQVPDSSFDASVARPAFAAGAGPRVVVDEAHHEFHTADGRYKPFADLLRNDGFRVRRGLVPFTPAALDSVDLLVISNAMGSDTMSAAVARRPAFTPAECAAVEAWVRDGGALLLIADHAPMGEASQALAERFGVTMSGGYVIDTVRTRGEPGGASNIPFSDGSGLASGHPIAQGRDTSERVGRVRTFTGQALRPPAGATALLALSDAAVDILPDTPSGLSAPEFREKRRTPVPEWAQGLAMRHGRGRVVMLGEAGMLSAQLILRSGREPGRMGMNVAGNDNRRFALNLARWLAGVLEPDPAK